MKRPLLLSFFLSGLSCLIYEISWIRMLTWIFGVTFLSITTITSLFMAGLALGALLSGRLSDRAPSSSLRLYILFEACSGVFGLIVPPLIILLFRFYSGFPQMAGASQWLHGFLRFLMTALLLLPPATLMGATLPAISRYCILKRDDVGIGVGWLYGINTLGGFTGVLLSGFCLAPLLGIYGTSLLAALSNFSSSFIAWMVLRGDKGQARPVSRSISPSGGDEAGSGAYPTGAETILVTTLFFFAGFTSLSLELLWTRTAVQFKPNSETLLFSTILMTYLLATGAGSLIFTRMRVKISPLTLFAYIQFIISLLILFSHRFVNLITPPEEGGGSLFRMMVFQVSGMNLDLEDIPFFLFAILPIALLYGISFPLVNRIFIREFKFLGRGVGGLYFFNVTGGIAGAFLTGFVFIPLTGMKHTTSILFSITFFSALAALFTGMKKHPSRRYSAPLLSILLFIPLLAVSLNLPPHLYLKREQVEGIRYYRDGLSSTTSVIWDGERRTHILFSGGERIFGSRVMTHLPVLLHENPERVFLIAYATGEGAFRMGRDPLVKEITCVELDGNQRETSRFFIELNNDILHDKRFRLFINDGRNYLYTTREEFDVIFNDASIHAYYEYMSTREFHHICRSRLREGGIYCIKLHPGLLSPEGIKGMVSSFLNIFPRATLWFSPSDRMAYLIGIKGKVGMKFREFRERMEARMSYENYGESAYSIGGLFFMDHRDLAALSKGSRMFTDLRPPHFPSLFLAGAMGMGLPDETRFLFRRFRSSPGVFFRGITKTDEWMMREAVEMKKFKMRPPLP